MPHTATETTPYLPSSTYRLQMKPGFGFKEALEIIPYLKQLGIGTVYFSPIFQAEPGSEHGYNIFDFNRLNPELGTEAEFFALADALHAEQIGVMLDFVPNHMGINNGQNPWFKDVLRWGQQSRYASHFDIYWEEHQGRVALGFFGADAADMAANGEIPIAFSVTEGLHFNFYGTPYPLRPNDYATVLQALADTGTLDARTQQQLHQLAGTVGHLEAAEDRYAQYDRLNQALAGLALQPALDSLNQNRRFIAELLERQHFDAQEWTRASFHDLNYRRFFTVKELAAVRTEDPTVFADQHALLKRLVDSGYVDAVRLDHIDGLRDPEKYLKDLRALLGDKLYLVAEKILAPHEAIDPRLNHLMQGTSGYDYLVAANRLFLQDSPTLQAIYQQVLQADFGVNAQNYADVERLIHASRLVMMETDEGKDLPGELNPEINRLTRHLQAAGFPQSPDILREGLSHFIAALTVYRSYFTPTSGFNAQDVATLTTTQQRAEQLAPAHVTPVLKQLGDFLRQAEHNPQAADLLMRIQQASGAIIAKGTEDTAFYVYHLNRAAAEVGAELEQIGLSVDDFMDMLHHRQQHLRHSMNASSTHDTKLGEDTRARIATLSQLPDYWQQTHQALQAQASQHAAWQALRPNDQYMLLQTLLGTLPTEVMQQVQTQGADAAATHLQQQMQQHASDAMTPPPYPARMQFFVEKALREAKQNSRWYLRSPEQEAYETLAKDAISAVLGDPHFLAQLTERTAPLAQLAARNSLAQTVLKLTTPGVPDIYQGSESWNLSTVDPDNRYTPDYNQLARQLTGSHNSSLDALAQHWPDGAVKQKLIQTLLQERQEHPHLFAEGELVRLEVRDRLTQQPRKDVLAFARIHGDEAYIVAVPVVMDQLTLPTPQDALGFGTLLHGLEVRLPDHLRGHPVTDMLNPHKEVHILPDSHHADQQWIQLATQTQALSAAVLGIGL